jgi:class I fructose-bisphosphate aldolase
MVGNSIFTKKRMYRVFRDDGRSLVVAMDHGSGLNVYPALTDPARLLDALVMAGADAVLTTPGILKQFFNHIKGVGVILRADGGSSELTRGSSAHRLLYSVEDGLRLGADAVACMGFPGSPWEIETLENLAALTGQCQVWGVPLMAEMIPGGFANPDHHTAEKIRLAVRIGIEMGADCIKTKFVGPPAAFQQVIEHAYRPVLVLGGDKTDDERSLFEMVKTALDTGAAGVVMGRQIWKHTHPQSIVKALNRLIHHNASVEEAQDVLASDGAI